MAVSKRARQLGKAADAPDPAAFLAVIDNGQAEPPVVVAAYRQAVSQWSKAAPPTDHPLDVVAERPEPDPDSPGARMVRLVRAHHFKRGL